jgi:hypothetical protein
MTCLVIAADQLVFPLIARNGPIMFLFGSETPSETVYHILGFDLLEVSVVFARDMSITSLLSIVAKIRFQKFHLRLLLIVKSSNHLKIPQLQFSKRSLHNDEPPSCYEHPCARNRHNHAGDTGYHETNYYLAIEVDN